MWMIWAAYDGMCAGVEQSVIDDAVARPEVETYSCLHSSHKIEEILNIHDDKN